jgi:hypothetical protein
MINKHKLTWEPEGSHLLKPIGTKTVELDRIRGKPVNITVRPHEMIDINMRNGTFFVRERFGGSKMKLKEEGEQLSFSKRSFDKFKNSLDENFTKVEWE